MTRLAVYRAFLLRFLAETGVGVLLVFLLSRIVAPPLISAHDTLQLIVGIAALAACPVILLLLGFRLWRTWGAFRRRLELAPSARARLSLH